ncbi:TlpA family protein disulfide reductase [Sphingobacterium sp. xlx-130]|uniref:TlpA family protein disulfide reductase n=1 Tax=Sphingobacterium sp. xlx-130 TaxID=2654323 RepID=UPI0013DD2AE5|nr:TlpA disulfide reductase family protein [Sphingobacterium sp. xlx-130]
MKTIKKLFVVTIVTFLASHAIAQTSIIKGIVDPEGASIKGSVSLMKIENGEPRVLTSAKLKEGGRFEFSYEPGYEGLYMVGSPKSQDGQFPVYIKPGDKAELIIEGVHARFIGDNTAENKKLGSWMDLTQSLKRKSVHFMYSYTVDGITNYEDFFPDLDETAKKAVNFRKGIKTGNPKFDELLNKLTAFDMEFYALQYLSTPRNKHPKKEDYPALYKAMIIENKFPDDSVFDLPYGKQFLRLYLNFATNHSQDVESKIALLSTNRQKGEYLLGVFTPKIQLYDQLKTMLDSYGQYFATKDQKEQVERLKKKFPENKSRIQAADFEFPNIDGDMVSLYQQKGKVVYVDVWATWCGPCRQQIPHLKELEKAMHGKDIVFISISTDSQQDIEKWKKMVREEEMGGIHLFAGPNSKIKRDYNITGIPRFILFDKEGRIILDDAPRPSDPSLKQILENELLR